MSPEYEQLLDFLYLLPLALLQLGPDGSVLTINPSAILLLRRVSPDGHFGNLFEILGRWAPSLHRAVSHFTAPHGTICEDQLIFTSGAEGVADEERPALSLTLVKVAPTNLMALVTEVTEEVRGTAERVRQAHVIRQLSTPIIEVAEGVLVLPIIGVIDQKRAMGVTDALLTAITSRRARAVVLDFTGADDEGDGVDPIRKMIGAAALLGAECFVTGVTPAFARRLVEEDVLNGATYHLSVRAALAARATARPASVKGGHRGSGGWA